MTEVGDVINAENARWRFSGDEALKFAKHMEKSIPGYREGHDLILQFSDFFISDNSLVYDLGCTIGTLAKKIAARHADKNVKVIGLDRESTLIEHAKLEIERDKTSGLQYEVTDITESNIRKSDLIVAYYTLQFVPRRDREKILKKIYKGLNPGGAFLIFEKVRASTSRLQDMISLLYNDFKLDNGYSGNEIVAKARSLKGVLEPISSEENLYALKKAGFSAASTLYKQLCFEGFLAVKD